MWLLFFRPDFSKTFTYGTCLKQANSTKSTGSLQPVLIHILFHPVVIAGTADERLSTGAASAVIGHPSASGIPII